MISIELSVKKFPSVFFLKSWLQLNVVVQNTKQTVFVMHSHV